MKATSSAVKVDQHSQNVSLHRVLEALDHPIYVIDARDYTIKLANAAAHCGSLPEHSTCYALTHNRDAPCSGAEHRCPLEEIKKTRKPVTTEHIHYGKDGNRRTFEVHGHPLFDGQGNITQVIEYTIDITERNRAEAQNYQYQQQLKSLVLQLTHAEEQEQKRIADILHDSLAQALVFLKIRIGLLSQDACSTVEAQSLTEINHSLQELLDKTRDLSFELSSPLLYTHGLEAALKEWLLEKIERKHGIETRLEMDETVKPLPEKLRVLLFRSTQELVTNVAKHAEANQVMISIKHREHGVEIGVRDDGIGFETNRAEEIKGYGLFRIRERLTSAGGGMEVTSDPGQGALVRLRVPLDAIQNTAENKR